MQEPTPACIKAIHAGIKEGLHSKVSKEHIQRIVTECEIPERIAIAMLTKGKKL